MLGALIAAGASLAGGFMQSRNAAAERAQQTKFAKNAIQWKVEDAKAAGIHPIYALGANTVSYTPQPVGDYGISEAGQNIGRAIDTSLTQRERLTEFSARAQQLQLQNMELQNNKLASEIALNNQAGQAPSPLTENAIIAGQGNSAVTPVAQETIINKARPHHEPVARPESMWTRLPDGGYAANPSKETAEAMESNPLGQLQYAYRNTIVPMFTQRQSTAPPASWLPPGTNAWRFNAASGAWYPYLSKHYDSIRSKGTIR